MVRDIVLTTRMKDIRETCSFQQLIDILLTKSKTEIGKMKINDLHPFDDRYFLEQSLAILEEMQHFYSAYGLMPFTSSSQLQPLFDFALKGGILTPRDFSLIATDIENVTKTLSFINHAEGEYPLIRELIRDFQDETPLLKVIHNVISPTLAIYDDASAQLKSIRHKIQKAENDLKSHINSLANQYHEYLTEKTITMRNGHYVLPVRISDKGQVNGIVHDVSSTGMTVFIEPSLIVEQNNLLLLLHQQEEDEIKEILSQLTKIVLNDERVLTRNNELIGELDFIQAKAIYAVETESYVGHVSDKPIIDMKGARHPFIDRQKVVANDFYLDNEHRILILSGPNAGGKTVAMKCVALLCYMQQCGLAIMTSGPSNISMFDNYLCDIGDQQSLNDDLSTFSGHMEALKQILSLSNAHSLILIDEIGTGTDPQEGASLAIAIIEEFLKKNSFALISSHFSSVKEYAMLQENIVLGSMLFDEKKLLPLYKLRIGIPGKSYALQVAKQHGICEDIILRAEEILKNQQDNVVSQKLDKLESLINEQEKKIQDLHKREEKIAKDEKEIQVFYNDIERKKEHINEQLNRDKAQKLEALQQMIDETLEILKNKDLKYHEAVKVKKRIDDLLLDDQEIEEEQDDTSLNIDDYVLISDNGISGKIIRLRGNQVTIITSEGLTVQTKLNRVKKIKKPSQKVVKKAPYVEPIISPSIKTELNVIGLHVEEALEEVEKYLDNARLRHLKMVRIIHGSGTGALRTAIQEYLKKQSFVESYRLGNGNVGGVGATMVYLK